jgi:hypothetical protein
MKAIERSVLPLVVRAIWNMNPSANRQQVRGRRSRKKFKGSLPECAPDLFWWPSERTHLGTRCFPDNTPPIGTSTRKQKEKKTQLNIKEQSECNSAGSSSRNV